MRPILLFLGLLFVTACSQTAAVNTSLTAGSVLFAKTELERALASVSSNVTIELAIASEALHPEGYRIEREGNSIRVIGGAAAGAMYGGLELAEQIRLFGVAGISATEQPAPYLKRRGIKFNIPLDARTPSYTGASDAEQKNIPTVWDMNFWTKYLDNLARHRFNYVSLWNLHPFPSLVRVPGYEDIALEDVHRSTADWEEYYHLHATGLDDPILLENPEVVRKMTMDEKITFWREVMAYGKSRNIDFHLVTWNIFDYGIKGKYGVTDEIDNEITRDYFRKSVTQCFLTYPDLAGIGLTTGENMHRQSFEAKEDWAYDTYARGVLDAADQLPGRKITFIHRQHQTGAKDIAEKFKPLIDHPDVEFLYCFKYAKAHFMSATEQPYHQRFVKDIPGMKTIWGLRDDSNYHFRWGAPGYVRQFINNLPHDVAEGIYFGADQWIPGRDFLSRDSTLAGQLDIEKFWYKYLLIGRHSYDNNFSVDRIKAIVANRFPEIKNNALYHAWNAASQILPIVTGAHWGPVDFKWYPEACKSRPGPARNETGFHDVNRFISLPPHPYGRAQSIPDYVKGEPRPSGERTPLEIADVLTVRSDRALMYLKQFPVPKDRELIATLADIKSLAHLGHYYAAKFRGATYLAKFRLEGNEKDRQEAIEYLEQAQEVWGKYVGQTTAHHHPLWTNRVGYIDWAALSGWVAEDITIARNATVGEAVTISKP